MKQIWIKDVYYYAFASKINNSKFDIIEWKPDYLILKRKDRAGAGKKSMQEVIDFIIKNWKHRDEKMG